MQVGVDEARHERRAAPVDAVSASHAPTVAAALPRDAFDAVALDGHLAGVGRVAGGIADAHVGEGDLVVAVGRAVAAPAGDRTSTRLNSSHSCEYRMPSSA